MSEEASSEEAAYSSEIPLWLQASAEDFEGIDFEAPIAECHSVDCRDLDRLYAKAADQYQQQGDPAGARLARVFSMLSAVTNFHFKANDRNSPFGPMMIMEDRRSAIPEDFRGSPVAVLADVAQRTTNVVLKARISDVCWLLERRRRDLGLAAVASYVAAVEGLGSGSLKDHLETADSLVGLAARDMLRRALTMAGAFGQDTEELAAAKALLLVVKERALKGGNPINIYWFSEMDLDFSISDPGNVAKSIEVFLNNSVANSDAHAMVELWRLAARAYRSAKDEEGKFRCTSAAAECLALESEQQTSAMLGSHWLSEAIAEYHGVPGKRDRRTELRHKLVDMQSGISEEMSLFSHPMDLREIVAQLEAKLSAQNELIDLLLIFADLCRSPDPEKLRKDAEKSIRDHPFSSMFGSSFHDHEGKVTHKSEGGGFGTDGNTDAINVKIAQGEKLRREIEVSAEIRVARQYLMNHYYISEDTLHALLQHSPFVPHHLLGTFSLGFLRFFQGDYTSALYILTPMLENSLRHILKLTGHDVTTFDDASHVQEDRTISVLFEQMRDELEGAFGPAIIADIDHVFLSKPGPSIRHAVAHGLLSDGDPYRSDAIYACWLIFRLCCIPLFAHREEILLPS